MSRRPSTAVVVSSEHANGATVSVHSSVHVPAPAGEVWKRTEAMPRSDAAVAEPATVPRSGVPGSLRATATVLKSAAVANEAAGFAEEATNAAPEVVKPAGTAATRRAVSASATRVTPGSPRG